MLLTVLGLSFAGRLSLNRSMCPSWISLIEICPKKRMMYFSK